MRLKPALIGVLIAVTGGVLLFNRNLQDAPLSQEVVPYDFEVYLKARDHVALGEDPYRLGLTESGYKYSPAVLVPLMLLPDSHSYAWVTGKFFYVLMWLGALLIGTHLLGWSSVWRLGLGILLSWRGAIEALSIGQADFVILFGGVLAAFLLLRRPLLAGLLLGLFAAVKLPWGLLCLPFIFFTYQKNRKALKLLLSGMIISVFGWLIALPVVVFGGTRTLTMNEAWFQVLRAQSRDLFFLETNQSIWVTVLRGVGETGVLAGLAKAAMAVLGALVIRSLLNISVSKRSPNDSLAWITPWFLMMQLLNPLGWRWGSLLVVGAPFAMENPAWIHARYFRWALYFMLGLLFFMQSDGTMTALGIQSAPYLRNHGAISLYWVVLLALC